MMIYYPHADPINIDSIDNEHKLHNTIRVLTSDNLHHNIKQRAQEHGLKALHGLDIYNDIDGMTHIQPVGVIVGKPQSIHGFRNKHSQFLNEFLMHHFLIHHKKPQEGDDKKMVPVRMSIIKASLRADGGDVHKSISEMARLIGEHGLPQSLVLLGNGNKSAIVQMHSIHDWHPEDESLGKLSKKKARAIISDIDEKTKTFIDALSNHGHSIREHKKMIVHI